LRSIQAPEARTEALRAVVRKLIRKGQGPRAVGLASRLATGNEQVPDYTALVALEMVGSDDGNARKLAEQAQSHYKPAAGGAGKLPVSPFLIALWMALNAPEKARSVAAEPGQEGEPDPAARLGYAEGYARQGNLDRARQLALARGPLEARLQALATVAATVLNKSSGDAKDLQAAVDLLEKEGKGRSAAPWSLWRLARSGARAGHNDLARQLAGAIQDPALRGRAQVEVFRARLLSSNEVLDFAIAEEAVEKKSPAYGVALEELARHNARRGSSADVLKAIDSWDPEWLRPLGYVGVALGEQK